MAQRNLATSWSYTECSLALCIAAQHLPIIKDAAFNNIVAVAIISTAGMMFHGKQIARERQLSTVAACIGHVLIHYFPLLCVRSRRPKLSDGAMSLMVQVLWAVCVNGGFNANKVYRLSVSDRRWAAYWGMSALVHLSTPRWLSGADACAPHAMGRSKLPRR